MNEMETEFGYALGNLIIVILTSIAAVVLFDMPMPLFVYTTAMDSALFASIYMLARVRIDEKTIHIGFALPFRKPKRINHEEVDFYGPMKGANGKARAFMGILKHRVEKKGISFERIGNQEVFRTIRPAGSYIPCGDRGTESIGSLDCAGLTRRSVGVL